MTDQYNDRMDDELDDDEIEEEFDGEEEDSEEGGEGFDFPETEVGMTFDETAYVKVIALGSDARWIAAEGPITVAEVLRRGHIVPLGPVDYTVAGAAVQIDTLVYPGQALSIAGNVKGG